jgi:hypothetical protein
MPYVDVKTDNPNWEAIQRVGLSGLMRGVGKPQAWANRTFFYPDSLITMTDLARCLSEWGYQPVQFKSIDSTKKLSREIAIELILDFTNTSNFCILKGKAFQRFKQEFEGQYKLANQDRAIKRIELASMLDFAMTKAFSFGVSLKGEIEKTH